MAWAKYGIMVFVNVALQTFGCRLNRAEALDHEARLLADGHCVVPLDGGVPPDIIVVRGCSVTAKAERDCRKAIARLRLQFPSARIEITGCLKAPSSNSQSPTLNSQLLPLNSHPVPLRTARAYLKIQDGCSGRCAFCIVPSFRGKPRSVPFAQVLTRAQAFLAAGYREIVVTGCNLALYRDSGHGLGDLLSALATMGTDPNRVGTDPSNHVGTDPNRVGTDPWPPHRIRLSSLEPGVCDDAVLEAFATHPNICRFIHLSVQSGSVPILKRMNRPYTIEAVDSFCSKAERTLGLRLALGADIITGFPGETENDFVASRDFILRYPFVNLHVFPYSERPGTPAATMEGSVPLAVRRARAKELERIGHIRREAFAKSFLGQDVEVCIERDGIGWTAEYLKCVVEDPIDSKDFKGHKNLADPNCLGRQMGRRSLVKARVVRVEGDNLHAIHSVI